MNLGINLCFAVKRRPEPEQWAAFVREELGLTSVQFTFDLLDPWWPTKERDALVARAVRAATEFELTIHSAYTGLAHYVPAGLLDPDPDARKIALKWWQRACDVAAGLGALAVGGPLGTMSVRDVATEVRRTRRWEDLLDGVEAVTGFVRAAGLAEFLIEPTPIAREVPSSIDECQLLLSELESRAAVPVGLVLDTGHTLFEPLYGPDATVTEWVQRLGTAIHMVHLDNTDGQGDPHWGWPDSRGKVDVGALGADLRAAGIGSIPVMLEVYPRFEDDDEQVRQLMVSSVAHCLRAFA